MYNITACLPITKLGLEHAHIFSRARVITIVYIHIYILDSITSNLLLSTKELAVFYFT